MPTWQLPILKFILWMGAFLRQMIYTMRGKEVPASIYKEARALLK
jgi:hypothetical protein